ncbi:MAG TPA: DUF4124 domain-containing protein [Steroidobacteraceae bacterium]|nr:DUF4124 domain-containing protein [Steroidobacteraceae bacterium]
MSARGPRIAGMVIGLAVLMPAAAGAAGSNDKQGVAYRWVDENGVVHYGDQVPPQYAQKQQSVLNSQGVVVRQFDAQKTPEQLAADELKQQSAIRQKQHDSFLLTTYTSVADIEALRDIRLDQLRGQQVAAEQYVENLHSRLTALQGRAKLFKPYSSRPEARRMPDDLAEDLVRTLNELHTQSGVLVTKGEEEKALRAQFQADIERYRQLHVKHVQ